MICVSQVFFFFLAKSPKLKVLKQLNLYLAIHTCSSSSIPLILNHHVQFQPKGISLLQINGFFFWSQYGTKPQVFIGLSKISIKIQAMPLKISILITYRVTE